MKVKNMTSSKGNSIANQFVIEDKGRGALGNFIKRQTFQSYRSIIVVKTVWEESTDIELDKTYWDYSVTTSKYRNQFLGETKKETQAKIDSGEYRLVNLN